jgi:hypothetical protein
VWSQVNHWLESCVCEGVLAGNTFKSVLYDQKVRPKPYAVPTDEEVSLMLAVRTTCILCC